MDGDNEDSDAFGDAFQQGEEDGLFDFFSGRSLAHTDDDNDAIDGSSKARGIWKPLPKRGEGDSIRILSIETADEDGTLFRCSLQVTSLYNPSCYQALSYAWGPERPTEWIVIDGNVLFVSRTLKAALYQVRRRWDSELLLVEGQRPALWVDAICINQADELEKGSQVTLMDQIYSKAACTLIWLDYIPFRFDDGDHVIDDMLSVQNISSELQGKISARLSRSPWFSRRWTLQEFQLAKSRLVLFRDLCFPFSVITNALRGYFSPQTPDFWNAVWAKRQSKCERCMLNNMINCHDAQCSDPRDTMYALRSISTDGKDFFVDYRQNVTATYLRFARFYACTPWLPLLLWCAAARKTEDRDYDSHSDSEAASSLRVAPRSRLRYPVTAMCIADNDPTRLPSWVPNWDRFQMADWIRIHYKRNPHKSPIFPFDTTNYRYSMSDLEASVVDDFDSSDVALIFNSWVTTDGCSHELLASACLNCKTRQGFRIDGGFEASGPRIMYCTFDGIPALFELLLISAPGLPSNSAAQGCTWYKLHTVIEIPEVPECRLQPDSPAGDNVCPFTITFRTNEIFRAHMKKSRICII